MKRTILALCSSLVVVLFASTAARADDAVAEGYKDDTCPAASRWACHEAGGYFFKYDGKKFCAIEGDGRFLKCQPGYKAIATKNVKYSFSPWGKDYWDRGDCRRRVEFDIKCFKKKDGYGGGYGGKDKKADGSYDDNDWFHGYTPVADEECENKCKLY